MENDRTTLPNGENKAVDNAPGDGVAEIVGEESQHLSNQADMHVDEELLPAVEYPEDQAIVHSSEPIGNAEVEAKEEEMAESVVSDAEPAENQLASTTTEVSYDEVSVLNSDTSEELEDQMVENMERPVEIMAASEESAVDVLPDAISDHVETSVIENLPDEEEPGDIIEQDVSTLTEEKDQRSNAEDENSESGNIESDSVEETDYSSHTREQLVSILEALLIERDINTIRVDVDNIKSNFYKKYKAEIEAKRRNFVIEGGEIHDFKPEADPLETTLKELLLKYRDIKSSQNRVQEKEKEENLLKKQEVIEAIKELVNRKESINQTFNEFRELQKQWHEIGQVPQSEVKNLWETYHLHLENFYSYIKINKELRDLDLKKNLETKIFLCEKAEELIIEPSIKTAFNELQKLHDQWRETGPVPVEKKDELWERFREATNKINKKHQDYYITLKAEQDNNLEAKIHICEKIEAIAASEITSHKEWSEKSKEIADSQQMWRTIGFAPKKHNAEIYKRYKQACDDFFNKKKEYYKDVKDDQGNNLQLKTELCLQAESLKDSTDWKKTTAEFIELQNKWKEIGPVPRKKSEAIWKRFRNACDQFFARKSEFFSSIDTVYEENLKAKEDLIAKVELFEPTDNVRKDLEVLKGFQKEWTDIGFVPMKRKADLQTRFRTAINKKFDSLQADEQQKNIIKFKSRLDEMSGGNKSDDKVKGEREKIVLKIKKMESDIQVWENNIGFFNNSKNAEALIKDVRNKIDKAKETMEMLRVKLDMIDKIDD